MKLMFIPYEMIDFCYDDGTDSIFGKAYLEKISVNSYTFKFSKNNIVDENSLYEINVIVHGGRIIGKGARKYHNEIMEAINHSEMINVSNESRK